MKKKLTVVSCSGGKDSTATLLLALDTMENVQAVFADTGNEHLITYQYLMYLEEKLKIKIDRIQGNFQKQLEQRKKYISVSWEKEGINQEKIKKSLKALTPTGNPFLDLSSWKGRFPSSQARFCTEELKTKPLIEYILNKVKEGYFIENWQGVRAEESPHRANLVEREKVDEFVEIVRPIHKWTAEDVFSFHKSHGIDPNPLYKMGMGRVGCMPCIHSRKKEIAEIALRFPEQIKRIAEWEKIVGNASKRDCSTFFPSPGVSNEKAVETGNIYKVVEWAEGKKPSFFLGQWEKEKELKKISCSSEYGLCD